LDKRVHRCPGGGGYILRRDGERTVSLSDRAAYQRPTRGQIEAAQGKRVPDVIARGLNIIFCGINPGLYSGAVGHHFARPGNRFWKALHMSGLTPRRLEPREERDLLEYGCGITNLVARATATANQVGGDELVRGRRRLLAKVRRYKPRVVAILGIGAYRTAFGDRKAQIGPQRRGAADSELWVLPNPSGLNASYLLPDLARLLRKLKRAAFRPESSGRVNP
jgi:TDG/mug DNA glycosylase family protein